MTLAHIGRFQVERALGSGSFATVWLARDQDLDAWVAIKLLAENWSLNEDARRRFMEEAKALRLLDSDRIVRVYEVGKVSDGRPYMVMEYADRGTLEDRMRLRAQLDQSFSVGEAVALSLDIAECLIAVHDLRIVHRDVKPSNVLFRGISQERQQALRREGKPVQAERTLLGDFGIARRLEGILGHTQVLGSPQYMAPEQADPHRARTVDYRSDVYSATVILFELMAGQLPFRFETLTERQEAGHPASPPDVRTYRPEVGPELAGVIARGLACDPDDRFASAWDWREALRSAALPQAEGDLPAGAAADRVAAVPERVSTAPAQTRTGTHVLPDRPGQPMAGASSAAEAPGEAVSVPAIPEGTTAAPRLRVLAATMVLASFASVVGALMPWTSAFAPNVGVARDRLGVSFRGGGAVLACAIVLFFAGTRLWRTRRRWVAALASAIGLLAGVVSFATAVYELARIRAHVAGTLPGSLLWRVTFGPGLYVVLGAAVVASLSGFAALRRQRRARRRQRYPMLRTA